LPPTSGLPLMSSLKALCCLPVQPIPPHPRYSTHPFLRMPNPTNLPSRRQTAICPYALSFSYDTSPSKLVWTLTPSIIGGIRYAETRLSDLICQNDCQALEFKGYGKNFITSHGFSPDAFVQMAFQAASFGRKLHKACERHVQLKKECSHHGILFRNSLHTMEQGWVPRHESSEETEMKF
jgi:hypothetical protein